MEHRGKGKVEEKERSGKKEEGMTRKGNGRKRERKRDKGAREKDKGARHRGCAGVQNLNPMPRHVTLSPGITFTAALPPVSRFLALYTSP